jgi:hypothetical protein
MLPPDQLRIAQGRISRLLEQVRPVGIMPPPPAKETAPQPPSFTQDRFQAATPLPAPAVMAQPVINIFEVSLPPLHSIYKRPALAPAQASPTSPSIGIPPKAIPVPESDAVAAIPAAPPSSSAEPAYEKSRYHDPLKFVPTYPMMAYHESGEYRNAKDPYAVGAITFPTKQQDLGGKTYGAYQFESYVYKNGTRGKSSQVNNSTLVRFLKSPNNPFGSQLKQVADRYGIASTQFDQLWKKFAAENNQAFGKAQEAFLLQDKKSKVDEFLTEAQLSDTVKKDPRIFDLVLGTLNHVDSLAEPIPTMLARKQREKGRPLSADEVGQLITWFKGTKVTSWFISSPKAQKGVRNRFRDEGKVFA